MSSDSQNPQTLMLLELADALLRSWWTVVAGACCGLTIAIIVLQVTPKIFEARAAIYADADRLPDEFVRPTVEDATQLDLKPLRAAVLSDANLDQLVEEIFGPFASDQERTHSAYVVRNSNRVIWDPRAKMISVYFRHADPSQAAVVANALAGLFVQENYRRREERATQITESMKTLSTRVEEELRLERKARNEFMSEHQNETEARRDYNERKIQQYEDDLEDLEASYETARGQVGLLEAQAAQGSDVSPIFDSGDGAATATSASARILEIEAEIEELLLRVTENHPDVQAKRRHVADLLKQAEKENDVDDPQSEPVTKPGLDIWQTRVRAAQLEVRRVEQKILETRRGIDRYEGYLASTSDTERRLRAYNERVDLLEEQNLDNQARLASARRGQQLEEEKLGNPFVITDRASPPTIPVSPNKVQTLAAGIVGGLLVFLSPLLVKFFLKPVVSSEARLRLITDLPILISVPTISTPEVASRRRWMHMRNFGISFLSLVILAAVAAVKYFDLIGN